MTARSTLRRGSAVLVAVLLAGAPVPSGSQEPRANDAQLRQEVEALKAQLQRLEQQMQQQQELIRRLTNERVGTPAAPVSPPPSVATPPAVAPPAGAPPAPPARVAAPPAAPPPAFDAETIKQQILDELRPQLAAANRTFPSQFNPAIGFIVDTVVSNSRRDKGNFEFRSGELGVSASVDPFARAYAIINGTPNGVDVEEAAIVTTALPWNLTVKGGRFFAEFGRLSTFHDHDLPFVNRPFVLDRFIGGESQADGVEVNWLAPISHYVSLTVGAYNKVGPDNDRVSNTTPRDWSEFTYLGRATTFFSLTDNHSLDLGLSDAYTPEVRVDDLRARNLFGVDLTFRYIPLASASYRGFVWGTEFLINHEARQTMAATDVSPAIFRYRDALGLYTYFEARLSRRFYPGLLLEYVQDMDRPRFETKAISPYLTIWASEFHRLRLQYTHLFSDLTPSDDRFFLQWTAIIGSHVHTFRDR